MATSNKKKSVRRSAFIFKDMTFYKDPCDQFTVLHTLSGGVGIEGIKAPTVIMGPADTVRQIVAKLQRP